MFKVSDIVNIEVGEQGAGTTEGVIVSVRVYDDMTVCGIVTRTGDRYAREAGADLIELAEPAAADTFRGDMRYYVTTDEHTGMHELAVIVIANEATERAQIAAWFARHGLDALPTLNWLAVLDAREADHAEALAAAGA